MSDLSRSLPNPALAADFLAAVRDWLEERDAQRAKQAEKEAEPVEAAQVPS